MIKRATSQINKCIIHKVANKFNGGQNAFSEKEVIFDEASYDLLLPFLLKPFTSVTQSYRFTNSADIRLNSINKFTREIFEDENSFVDQSKNIVNHLFEQSDSAQIKTGDVLVVHFDNIVYEDITTEAIGVFKIESKVNFFQTFLEDNNFDVVIQKGISTKKLDKGCLILNASDTEGTVVLSVDNNNYDAQYWINKFLEVKYANDSNLHTQEYLQMCKEFAEEVINPSYGKQEQGNFLANTVDFFKENESIDIQEFKDEIFQDDKQKKLFEDYKKEFEDLNDSLIRNNFEVSDSVFKKEKGKLKTKIKLDTNIQIHLDIDAPDAAAEYLERGYDDDRKMHYYKVYFNAEA